MGTFAVQLRRKCYRIGPRAVAPFAEWVARALWLPGFKVWSHVRSLRSASPSPPPTRGKSQVFATSFRAIASRRTYLSRLWEDHKTRIATVLSAPSRVRRNAWSISLSPGEPLHTQSKHGLDKQTLNVSTPRRALHGPCPENSPGLPQKSILRKISRCSLGYQTQVSHLKSEYHAGMPGASAKAIDLIRGIGRHWRIWLASHLRREKSGNLRHNSGGTGLSQRRAGFQHRGRAGIPALELATSGER